MPYAIVDFETTGVVPERTDRVIEVGVVLLDDDGERENEWSTLVNPQRDVGASHVHGIRPADVLDAPEFGDIADDLLGLVMGRTVVAHNASFDMRFLHAELKRSGYGISRRPAALCSMKWARRLIGASKLEHCCEALRIPLVDAHSALADARATASLVAHLSLLGSTMPEWVDDVEFARSFGWPRRSGRVTRAHLVRRVTPDRELRPS